MFAVFQSNMWWDQGLMLRGISYCSGFWAVHSSLPLSLGCNMLADKNWLLL
jgi:hypothetical protein